jgi:hypothetical protein
MAALSLAWPVSVEGWPEMPDDFARYVAPAGGRLRFSPQHASLKDVALAADEANGALAAALGKIGTCAAEPQVMRSLLWLFYNRSLFLARAYVPGAIASARLGLRVNPQTLQLRLLVKNLEKTGKPVKSARPYLPPTLE